MSIGSDPFLRPPGEPTRSRSLREDPLNNQQIIREEATSTQIGEPEAKALFDGFVHQINRATALLKVVEPEAAKLSIPVDADAVQVRSAVRRRDQGSDGSTITFDLYKDMIEYTIKAGRGMSFEVLGEFSGDLQTDANKINRFIKSGGKGLSSWEEFLLYADQWLVLFMLNRLIGMFQCQEHKECTAGKTPIGTEDPALQSRYALAVNALMYILGMREQDITLAATVAGNALNIPPVDIINKAKRLEQTDLDRALVEQAGASDHVLIIRYVENYVSRHPEGYETWMAYADLKRLREDAKVTYIYAREYSADHRMLLDYSYKSSHTQPGVGFFGKLAGVSVMMTGAHYQTLQSKLAGIDLGITSIASVLTNQFALDVLCCLARFFGRQNLKTLKRIRALLQVAANGMYSSLGQGLTEPWGVMDWVVNGVLQGAVSFVEQVFTRAVADVHGWINLRNAEQWDALSECPLILDLLEFIIQAIARLRNIMFNMVNRYVGNVNWKYQSMFRRWGTTYENRRLRTIIGILTRVIDAIEICSDTDTSPPGESPIPPFDPGDDPTLTDLSPKRLDIPPEIIEKYFKEDVRFIDRGAGLRPLPPVNRTFTSADDTESNRNFRELCHGILPESLLKAMTENKN
jgi:hypothetical protein